MLGTHGQWHSSQIRRLPWQFTFQRNGRIADTHAEKKHSFKSEIRRLIGY
jgi:hypothetical protein